MAVRVGLMGLGRIGRNLFRILYNRATEPTADPAIEIAAISDIADPAALEYLLRFDTILGRFPSEVSIKEGHLYVAGRQIPVLAGEKPGDVDWAALGVDVVIEATGKQRSRAELEQHLAKGARRVILCTASSGAPDITVVRGVNDHLLASDQRVVSNASVTAHCAAPVIRLLHDAFGIERLFLTTVHAYSNKQRLADVPSEDRRRGRAAAENIIPQATKVATVLTDLVPELAGRIQAMAVNVPIANGSVVDLVAWHQRPVSVTAINEVIRTAASMPHWRGILDYEADPIVSSDIIRSSYSCTFDSLATMVLGDHVSKTLSWYDNGWGYAHRCVELVERFAALDQKNPQQEAA